MALIISKRQYAFEAGQLYPYRVLHFRDIVTSLINHIQKSIVATNVKTNLLLGCPTVYLKGYLSTEILTEILTEMHGIFEQRQ